MKILFVCTSNKDRSPALQKYFEKKYPAHKYSSAGVNKYFCTTKGTTLITQEMVDDADVIVCAENIHSTILHTNYNAKNKKIFPLNCGDYEQGSISLDYLQNAELVVLKNVKL